MHTQLVHEDPEVLMKRAKQLRKELAAAVSIPAPDAPASRPPTPAAEKGAEGAEAGAGAGEDGQVRLGASAALQAGPDGGVRGEGDVVMEGVEEVQGGAVVGKEAHQQQGQQGQGQAMEAEGAGVQGGGEGPAHHPTTSHRHSSPHHTVEEGHAGQPPLQGLGGDLQGPGVEAGEGLQSQGVLGVQGVQGQGHHGEGAAGAEPELKTQLGPESESASVDHHALEACGRIVDAIVGGTQGWALARLEGLYAQVGGRCSHAHAHTHARMHAEVNEWLSQSV